MFQPGGSNYLKKKKKKTTLKETGWLLRQQKFIVLLRKLSSENPPTQPRPHKMSGGLGLQVSGGLSQSLRVRVPAHERPTGLARVRYGKSQYSFRHGKQLHQSMAFAVTDSRGSQPTTPGGGPRHRVPTTGASSQLSSHPKTPIICMPSL